MDQTSNRSILYRCLLAVALFISAVMLPWWVTGLVALVALSLSPAEEVLLAGLIIDVLYGAPLPTFAGIEYAATILAGILYVVGYLVRMYAKRTFRR